MAVSANGGMSNTTKILGQAAPAAAITTTLYEVPLLIQTTASSIVICNRNTVPVAFRVSVAVTNLPDNAQQYLYYDQALEANSTFIATIGITLAATDAVRVQSSDGFTSFNLFGVEVSK